MECEITCGVCNKTLSLDHFYKCSKSNSGYRNKCKKCFNSESTTYRKSINGVITQMFASQKRNAKLRGHALPDYNKDQLKEWLFKQDIFRDLYYKWVKSGYDRKLSPSCDRINNNKSYSLNNLQLVTFLQNHTNETRDMKNGVIGRARPIIGINIITGEKKEFISGKDAERILGIWSNHIYECCNNKRRTVGGYTWILKSE